MNSTLRFLLFLFTLYLVFVFLGCSLQDRFIFQSQALPANYTFQSPIPFKEIWLSSADGVRLHALYFHQPDTLKNKSKGLILYFHGNKGNITRFIHAASDLAPYPYDILMPDYRSYGKSEGRPTEQHLYDDARTWVRWIDTALHPQQLIYYGRSLGAAVAIDLAVQHPPAKLILETPFDQLKSAVPILLRPMLTIHPLKYTFNNQAKINQLRCEVLAFHGTHDRLVPLSSAQNLARHMNERGRLIILDGATHHNVYRHEGYRVGLDGFLRKGE